MIPDSHIKEYLHRAYVQAVAAQAGYGCEFRGPDYGADAVISEVEHLPNGKRVATGYEFNLQMKASQVFIQREDATDYDLDAEAHNRLVRFVGNAIVLIVFCISPDVQARLTVTEDYLQLQHCCYWYPRPTEETTNRRSTRIAIPRNQLFTPEACTSLMEGVKKGWLRA